jgi:RimJ/RimL family protein N-acetyltransferase
MLPCPDEIRTERLILRRWREDDLSHFARLNADPQVMRFFHKTRTRDESDWEARWFAERFAVDGFGPWAVEVPDVAPFAGFVGVWRIMRQMPFTPAVEIGWRFDEPHWGQGYATEAAKAALQDVFLRTDVPEVVAYTTQQNQPSRRVMEKLGMRYDPAADFDHPAVSEGHPLRRHVLYRISREAFASTRP